MKTKVMLPAIFFCLCFYGCAQQLHLIGYDIVKSSVPQPNLGRIYILSFTDERPQQERQGVKGKLLSFSSKDSHFKQKPVEAIAETLSAELHNLGFSFVQAQDQCDYKISGSLKHFQAIMSPAKITFLPYLGSVSTLWAKDEFTVALSIYVKMSDRSGQTLIDKTFDVSEDMRLPTGLLSLARYMRGFNFKLKLLDEALKDVIRQIIQEIKTEAKNRKEPQ